MTTGYSMCCRQAAINKQTTKASIAKEKAARTSEITRLWKEGFKALKEENDRLQKEAKEWHEQAEDDCALTYEQEINACREEFM